MFQLFAYSDKLIFKGHLSQNSQSVGSADVSLKDALNQLNTDMGCHDALDCADVTFQSHVSFEVVVFSQSEACWEVRSDL